MGKQLTNCFFSMNGPFIHFISATSSGSLIAPEKDEYCDFKVFITDGAVDTKENLFLTIARTLSFPDYFGKNWDAFDECLNDLSWLHAKGFVVVLKQADDLIKMPMNDLKLFFSVVTDAVENWQQEKIPLHFAFIGSDTLLQRLKAMVDKEICNH